MSLPIMSSLQRRDWREIYMIRGECQRGCSASGVAFTIGAHTITQPHEAQEALQLARSGSADRPDSSAAAVVGETESVSGERRYTPIELLELMVLADLRRKGFTVARIRKLLDVLRGRFKTRLYDAIEGGGPVTLYIDGDNIYARTDAGEMFSILDNAAQPLMMMGEDLKLRQLIARERPARPHAKRKARHDRPGASRP